MPAVGVVEAHTRRGATAGEAMTGRPMRTAGVVAMAAAALIGPSLLGAVPQAGAATQHLTQSGRVYVEGHPVGGLYGFAGSDAAGSEGQVRTFDMLRTNAGGYGAIGQALSSSGSGAESGHVSYFTRSASGSTFHGGAIRGADVRYSPVGVAAAQSPSGDAVYAALAVTCARSNGGLYVLRKSVSAVAFPPVQARQEALADTTTGSAPCDDDEQVDGMAALPAGRVAVLAQTAAAGLQLLVGRPDHTFTDRTLHFSPFLRSAITRDPDTGRVVIVSYGRSINPGTGKPDVEFSLNAWIYRTDRTLHGPTALPRSTMGDQVVSVTAAAGQVWVSFQDGNDGSDDGNDSLAAVIHRNRKGHWGKPSLPAAAGNAGDLQLAAVPRTGVVQAVYWKPHTRRFFHMKRLANGHWTPPHQLPWGQIPLSLVSTTAGGYRYAYIRQAH